MNCIEPTATRPSSSAAAFLAFFSSSCNELRGNRPSTECVMYLPCNSLPQSCVEQLLRLFSVASQHCLRFFEFFVALFVKHFLKFSCLKRSIYSKPIFFRIHFSSLCGLVFNHEILTSASPVPSVSVPSSSKSCCRRLSSLGSQC